MKIKGVDHITINMVNVKESFDFYENVIGLERIKNVDMGDHELYLYDLSDIKLELIEYKEEQKRIQAGNTDVGVYRHFALCVDDFEECRRRCEQAGYGINMYPEYIEQIGQTVMLIRDPNGVEIEMIQA